MSCQVLLHIMLLKYYRMKYSTLTRRLNNGGTVGAHNILMNYLFRI